MKPERHFVAERIVAQHCPDLLRPAPGPAELLPNLGKVGRKLGRAVASGLSALLNGKTPVVRCLLPERSDATEFSRRVAHLAANSLLVAGPQDVPLLVTIEAEAVLRLVDRTFGGRGDVPNPMPEDFPMSAELMIQRLENLVATRLGEALEAPEPDSVRPQRRDGSLHVINPFLPGEPLALLVFEIEESAEIKWTMCLALSLSALPALFDRGDGAAATPGAPTEPASPLSQPFAEMPLELTAVLVDTRMPMAVAAMLKPGVVLPVAVARAVPLKIAGKIVARGAVGSADDRIAIRITQAF